MTISHDNDGRGNSATSRILFLEKGRASDPVPLYVYSGNGPARKLADEVRYQYPNLGFWHKNVIAADDIYCYLSDPSEPVKREVYYKLHIGSIDGNWQGWALKDVRTRPLISWPKIYFSRDDGIYVFDTTVRTQPTKLVPLKGAPRQLTLYEESRDFVTRLYYLAPVALNEPYHTLRRCDLDGKNDEQIKLVFKKDHMTLDDSRFVLCMNRVYFSAMGDLYWAPLAGGNARQVGEYNLGTIPGAGDRLDHIFATPDEAYVIFKTDGKGFFRLGTDHGDEIAEKDLSQFSELSRLRKDGDVQAISYRCLFVQDSSLAVAAFDFEENHNDLKATSGDAIGDVLVYNEELYGSTDKGEPIIARCNIPNLGSLDRMESVKLAPLFPGGRVVAVV